MMDVFRFARLPPRANDPTRRYQLVRGDEREPVGRVEIGGDALEGDTVLLTVTCRPVLSDAAREDALGTARRFLDELAAGWGVQVAAVSSGAGWAAQADGGSRIQEEYRVVCANP